ncbi:MAG: HD-GYP domain-containing protein [Phycisphaerae bacterium]
MRERIRTWLDASDATRPVGVCIVAMACMSGAMAVMGWHVPSLMLVPMMVLLGVLVIIQVHRNVRDLKGQSHAARRAAIQAEQHYIDVLGKIIGYIESRDVYARGRSERIGWLSEQIARRMGLDSELCRRMNVAGRLHDIGLLAVPESILNKRSRLGADEFHTVQKHAEVSFEVLKPLTTLQDVLPAVRAHHERMNGTGYPEGLKGQQIPQVSRILAVADAYDAMTHDRPWRPAMTPLEAMRELIRCSPAGYDPDCIRALGEVINMPALERAFEASGDVAETQTAAKP